MVVQLKRTTIRRRVELVKVLTQFKQQGTPRSRLALLISDFQTSISLKLWALHTGCKQLAETVNHHDLYSLSSWIFATWWLGLGSLRGGEARAADLCGGAGQTLAGLQAGQRLVAGD